MPTPPILPTAPRGSVPSSKPVRLLILLSVCVAAGLILLLGCRLAGWVIPFSVPAGAMIPTISPGDQVLMEGFTYWFRKPHRGDLVVFKTSGVALLPPDQVFVKRLVGEPGERLRMVEGRLLVNDQPVSIRNATGELHYVFIPQSTLLRSTDDATTIPSGSYFVLGDNSPSSSDSRFWGPLPATNLLGRVVFCYWPPDRMGRVK